MQKHNKITVVQPFFRMTRIGDRYTVLAIGGIGDMSGNGEEIEIAGAPGLINQAVHPGAEGSAEFGNFQAKLFPGDLWGSTEFNGSTWLKFSDPVIPLGQKTIAFWLKSTASGDNVLFCNCLWITTYHGDIIALRSGKIYFSSMRGVLSSPRYTVNGSKTVNDGAWHHILCSWNGTTSSNSVKLYTDGILDAQGTAISAETTAQSDSLHIGYRNYPPYYPFTGSLSKILISSDYISTDFDPPFRWQEDYIDQVDGNTKLLIPMHGDTAYYHDEANHNYHDIVVNGEPAIQEVILSGANTASAFEFDGSNDWLDVDGSESGIESIDFWVNSDTNSRDIMQLSSTKKIAVDGSGNIALTGMTGWQILVDGSIGASVGTGAWHHVGLKQNTGSAVTADNIEIGRDSTYFDGHLANIRFSTEELDYASLWSAGDLYNLEDAY